MSTLSFNLKHLFYFSFSPYLSKPTTLLIPHILNPKTTVSSLSRSLISANCRSLCAISNSKNIVGKIDTSVEPKYLSCCVPDKNPLKISVLLSGGVDSSVAFRLHLAGHSCTAFYLKIWFQEDFENFWSECPWEDDLKYAKAVCDQVDVPLEVVHLTDEYWNNVVSYIIEEYQCGCTPNSDVLCNTRIKFGAFMDAVSGHYT